MPTKAALRFLALPVKELVTTAVPMYTRAF